MVVFRPSLIRVFGLAAGTYAFACGTIVASCLHNAADWPPIWAFFVWALEAVALATLAAHISRISFDGRVLRGPSDSNWVFRRDVPISRVDGLRTMRRR